MLKNHKLSKALSDTAFGETRRQLTYKALWYGSEIIVADRFFPSSKLCSVCGQVKEDLTLKDRIYQCGCGNILNRDLNAALNLKRYGEFHRSLSNQKACGEERLQSVAVLRTAVGGALQGSRNLTSNLSRVGRFV
jgi:putative transposase